MVTVEPAYASAVMRTNRRGADRRRGAAALIGAVARGLAASGKEAGQLRERFEEELRLLVRARSLAVRDEPEPAAADVMCFDIPPGSSHTRARIEAVFEPSRLARQRLRTPWPSIPSDRSPSRISSGRSWSY